MEALRGCGRCSTPTSPGSQDAYQAHGLPLMRHLALVTPGDSRAVGTDDEYPFGDDRRRLRARDAEGRDVAVGSPAPRPVAGAGPRLYGWPATARRAHRAPLVAGHRTVTARARADHPVVPARGRGGADAADVGGTHSATTATTSSTWAIPGGPPYPPRCPGGRVHARHAGCRGVADLGQVTRRSGAAGRSPRCRGQPTSRAA